MPKLIDWTPSTPVSHVGRELDAIYTAISGLTSDHGSLTGLGDDDHTQYTRVDGTRAMTGQLSLVGDPVSDPHAARKKYVDDSIAADLKLRDTAVKVLLRPPATTAHYHNPAADVILDAILAQLASADDVQLVFLPRTSDQLELPKKAGIAEVIVPAKVYDGPSLVAAVDMVISGGGTMTREAAIMGVPSYSFFRGTSGMVDEALANAGRLVLIEDADQVCDLLEVAPKKGTATQPDPGPLVQFICDAIEGAAS